MKKILAVSAILICLVVLATAGPARATAEGTSTILLANEIQVTFDGNGHSTPIIGQDAIGYYVVYSQYPVVNGVLGNARIYYQRVINGALFGTPVTVANSTANQWLNDASGDYIVYTLSPSVGQYGNIVLYQISTGQSRPLTTAGNAWAPKICGDVIVWVEITSTGAGQAVMYRLSSGVPVVTSVIAGPTPSVAQVAVGERFVVWSQIVNKQYDLAAYDLQQGTIFPVANDAQFSEKTPSTEGPWIVFEEQILATPNQVTIKAVNIDTGERRTAADYGARNARPSISGNLISYESNVLGNWQIFVYRIQQGDTFLVTNPAYNERLSDVKDNLVTYTELNPPVNETVFVSTLAFNNPPVADPGPDQYLTLLGTKVQLDGSASYDVDGDPLTYAWTLTKPDGSDATLDGANTSAPTFVADVQGTYTVRLVVSDPWVPSAPKTVTISFNNIKPVANVGTSQSVALGAIVNLDGSSSQDANGDPLTYQWSLTPPQGSSAAIADPTAILTSFVPDLEGSYVVSLMVNDGFVDSEPSLITIQVTANANTVVKTIQTSLMPQISGLSSQDFKNANLQNALLNKLNLVIQQIDAGNYTDALWQLENDILGKVDGVARTGKPDKNDWIVDPTAQPQIYNTLMNIIAELRTMQ